MMTDFPQTFSYRRLSDVDPELLIAHMSDPKTAEHMPLMPDSWDHSTIASFVATKEAAWTQDGLGHWAIFQDDRYLGWGGFQKEGDEWDLGLVLTPDSFGLGFRITRDMIRFAKADPRIPYATFLLPPTRQNLGALRRIGAVQIGTIDYDGATFLKFRLDTPPD